MKQFANPALGGLLFFMTALGLSLYFTMAAVQGDYGLFRRVEVSAETEELQAQLAQLQQDITVMENLVKRLSDTSLDLDLLDERARLVLGMMRSDEIIIP